MVRVTCNLKYVTAKNKLRSSESCAFNVSVLVRVILSFQWTTSKITLPCIWPKRSEKLFDFGSTVMYPSSPFLPKQLGPSPHRKILASYDYAGISYVPSNLQDGEFAGAHQEGSWSVSCAIWYEGLQKASERGSIILQLSTRVDAHFPSRDSSTRLLVITLKNLINIPDTSRSI